MKGNVSGLSRFTCIQRKLFYTMKKIINIKYVKYHKRYGLTNRIIWPSVPSLQGPSPGLSQRKRHRMATGIVESQPSYKSKLMNGNEYFNENMKVEYDGRTMRQNGITVYEFLTYEIICQVIMISIRVIYGRIPHSLYFT